MRAGASPPFHIENVCIAASWRTFARSFSGSRLSSRRAVIAPHSAAASRCSCVIAISLIVGIFRAQQIV